ncbi:MAG: hypothetical protein M5U07_20440 [Xanthobacteraceae bacterium]|nr:hypothetical protein [Xanthobacteraceae bacterium]
MTVHSLAMAVLCAAALAGSAAGAWAQTPEAPKVEAPPTGGPKPEGLAQPPAETAPASPAVEERTGSGPLEQSAPVRPDGPVPLPERPSEPHGAPKEIR